MIGNFFLSPSLPKLMGYIILNKNPLIEILADQIYQDPSTLAVKVCKCMPNLSYGNHLLEHILEALEKGAIPWPKEEFRMIHKTSSYTRHCNFSDTTFPY